MPATDLHAAPVARRPGASARAAARRRRAAARRAAEAGQLAGEAAAARPLRRTHRGARPRPRERTGRARAMVATSTPLGIEARPADEAPAAARRLRHGIRPAVAPIRPWGSAGGVLLARADRGSTRCSTPGDRARLPAEALVGRTRLAHVAPLLERLAAGDAPRCSCTRAPAAEPAAPAWSPRSRRTCGGHAGGMAAPVGRVGAAGPSGTEGGAGRCWPAARRCTWSASPPAAARRPPSTTSRAWFDVSSYGPKAVDAMLRVVGVDRLVHGSDRPVVDPPSLAALARLPPRRHPRQPRGASS